MPERGFWDHARIDSKCQFDHEVLPHVINNKIPYCGERIISYDKGHVNSDISLQVLKVQQNHVLTTGELIQMTMRIHVSNFYLRKSRVRFGEEPFVFFLSFICSSTH